MNEEIFAIFIPIIMFIGLFTTISLAFYFKYKTRAAASQNIPGESLAEWTKARSEAATVAGRAALLRVGGFLIGTGIGTLIGCLLMPAMKGTFTGSWIDERAWFVFVIIAIAIICGGAGMIGAYFLERRLDKNSK